MKKCVIISFGFDLSGVFRAYSEYSLKRGDLIVLVLPEPVSPRNESAVKDVESFLSGLKSKGVDIDKEVLGVDANDIGSIVEDIGEIIKEQKYQYYLEATGGIRSVCVAFTILGIIFKDKIEFFRTINEANGYITEVSLPTCASDISSTKRKILYLLKKQSGLTTKDLANELDKNVSTISRHLSELEHRFLVKKDSEYDARYNLTYVGKVLTD